MQLSVHEVDFEQHMREKARMWKPFLVTIGKDFAVFEFDNIRQRALAMNGVAHYADSYGYTTSAGPREQMSIVKGERTT